LIGKEAANKGVGVAGPYYALHPIRGWDCPAYETAKAMRGAK